jgi:hypothetical protein
MNNDTVRNVRFLGFDPAGEAVFQDLEYPSDAPRSVIVGTGLPALNSPDVFRMTDAQAKYWYGEHYDRLGDSPNIHPELQHQRPEQRIQEPLNDMAEIDQVFQNKQDYQNGYEVRRWLLNADLARERAHSSQPERQLVHDIAVNHSREVKEVFTESNPSCTYSEDYNRGQRAAIREWSHERNHKLLTQVSIEPEQKTHRQDMSNEISI